MNNYLVFKSSSRFYDDVNFPYGLDRAGIFTRTEVEILHGCGRTLKALYDGSQPPIGKDQERFVQVCSGQAEAESSVEKTWLKYIHAIGSKRMPVSFYADAASVDSMQDSYDESDLL